MKTELDILDYHQWLLSSFSKKPPDKLIFLPIQNLFPFSQPFENTWKWTVLNYCPKYFKSGKLGLDSDRYLVSVIVYYNDWCFHRFLEQGWKKFIYYWTMPSLPRVMKLCLEMWSLITFIITLACLCKHEELGKPFTWSSIYKYFIFCLNSLSNSIQAQQRVEIFQN